MSFGDILDEWEKQRPRRANDGKDGKEGKEGKAGKTGGPAAGKGGRGGPAAAREPADDSLERWLELHPVTDKDAGRESAPIPPAVRRGMMRRMQPEATIDLHGCYLQEALDQLQKFIMYCKGREMRKILVIHGKGFHSPEGPVLQKGIRDFLQRSEDVGETGVPPKEQGGDGATWAVLRYRSR